MCLTLFAIHHSRQSRPRGATKNRLGLGRTGDSAIPYTSEKALNTYINVDLHTSSPTGIPTNYPDFFHYGLLWQQLRKTTLKLNITNITYPTHTTILIIIYS